MFVKHNADRCPITIDQSLKHQSAKKHSPVLSVKLHEGLNIQNDQENKASCYWVLLYIFVLFLLHTPLTFRTCVWKKSQMFWIIDVLSVETSKIEHLWIFSKTCSKYLSVAMYRLYANQSTNYSSTNLAPTQTSIFYHQPWGPFEGATGCQPAKPPGLSLVPRWRANVLPNSGCQRRSRLEPSWGTIFSAKKMMENVDKQRVGVFF